MRGLWGMPKGLKTLLSLFIQVVLFISLSGAQPAIAAPLNDPIQVEMQHLLLTPLASGELSVEDRIVFKNTGDKSITTDFKLSLPEGYSGLEYLEGIKDPSQVVNNGQELVLKQEIPPGENAIALSYKLSATNTHFLINQAINYATPTFYILTPPEGLKVVGGEALSDGGVMDINGNQYHIYAQENLKPGDIVQLAATIGDAPSSSGSGVTRQDNPQYHNASHIRFWRQSPFAGINAHIFLVIVVAVPLAFIIYALYRRKRTSEDDGAKIDTEEQLFQKLIARQNILMDKLKELEGKKERQELDLETYQQLREAYKTKLV
ncbi:MAG: hypothetical protein ACYCX4_15945, partial [Bacillota bacterium]